MDCFKEQYKGKLKNLRGCFNKVPDLKERIIEYLTKFDIYLYAGHNNGLKLIPKEPIERDELDINAVSLLYGCNSVSYEGFGETGLFQP